MIIRCESGKLLDTRHVVEWDIESEGEGDDTVHTVVAKTVLDTSVEVFRGTEEACGIRLSEIYADLSEDGSTLRHLCESLAKRDDKLSALINRLARISS